MKKMRCRHFRFRVSRVDHSGYLLVESCRSVDESMSLTLIVSLAVVVSTENSLAFVRASVCRWTCKSTEKMWIKGFVSLGLLGVGYCLNGVTQLPFKIIQSLSCVFFLFCGDLFIKSCSGRKLDRKLLSITGIVCFTLVYVLSLFEEPNLNVISNRFPNNPIVTIVAAILGCVSVCCISMGIEVVKGIAGILSYYGMISLLIMGIHSEIRVVMIKALGMVGIQGLLQNIIVFLITLIIAIPIYELFSRFVPRLTGCKLKIDRCGGKNH